jgi:hypothetical protein
MLNRYGYEWNYVINGGQALFLVVVAAREAVRAVVNKS